MKRDLASGDLCTFTDYAILYDLVTEGALNIDKTGLTCILVCSDQKVLSHYIVFVIGLDKLVYVSKQQLKRVNSPHKTV